MQRRILSGLVGGGVLGTGFFVVCQITIRHDVGYAPGPGDEFPISNVDSFSLTTGTAHYFSHGKGFYSWLDYAAGADQRSPGPLVDRNVWCPASREEKAADHVAIVRAGLSKMLRCGVGGEGLRSRRGPFTRFRGPLKGARFL